jgi:hypothetical protein
MASFIAQKIGSSSFLTGTALRTRAPRSFVRGPIAVQAVFSKAKPAAKPAAKTGLKVFFIPSVEKLSCGG